MVLALEPDKENWSVWWTGLSALGASASAVFTLSVYLFEQKQKRLLSRDLAFDYFRAKRDAFSDIASYLEKFVDNPPRPSRHTGWNAICDEINGMRISVADLKLREAMAISANFRTCIVRLMGCLTDLKISCSNLLRNPSAESAGAAYDLAVLINETVDMYMSGVDGSDDYLSVRMMEIELLYGLNRFGKVRPMD